MTYRALDNLTEELQCLKAQNSLMDTYIRDGKIVSLFEMIRSQNQYLDYLIERTKSKGEKP